MQYITFTRAIFVSLSMAELPSFPVGYIGHWPFISLSVTVKGAVLSTYPACCCWLL